MSKKHQDSENNEASFDGQRVDEVVIKVFRRHIIAMRKGFYLLLGWLVVFCIPPLIAPTILELFILPFVGFGIGLIFFAYHFMIWYFTIFILTNQRLRQVTQRGFFGTDVVELKLSKIHNISYNIPGFSGEIFGFGTLVIQTYVGDLIIHNVDHPQRVYNALQDAVDEAAKQGDYEKDIST